MHTKNKHHADHGRGTPVAATKQIDVVFALEYSEANQVYLCGEFNQWSATNLPMIRRGTSRWERRLTLPPGRYEYKFVIDGNWTPDPYGSQEVVNAYGSTNSVAEVN